MTQRMTARALRDRKGTNGESARKAGNRGSGRKLFLEALEDRRLLATGVFDFNSAASAPLESAGTQSVQVDVTSDAALTGGDTMSVQVSVGAATASSGSDYTFTTATVTFTAADVTGAGTFSKNVSLSIVDDRRVEGNETVRLDLSNPQQSGGHSVSLGATAQHTATIDDNDTAVIDFEADKSTGEGPNGEVRAVMTIVGSGTTGTVGLDRTVTVDATDVTVPGAGKATGGGVDYTFTTTTYSFYAQSASSIYSIVAWVIPTNDHRLEGSETLDLSIGSLSSSLDGQVTIGDAAHTLTIVDNEMGAVSFEADKSTAESANPTLQATLVITGSGSGTYGLDTAFTVDVAPAAGGTATPGGVDYTFATVPVTFNAGDGSSVSSTAATVTVADDALLEGSETANFSLSNLSSTLNGLVSLGDTTHTLTILDNETGTINFEADKTTAENASTTLTATLTIGGSGAGPWSLDQALTVTATVAAGGTAEGADYALSAATLTFSPGAGPVVSSAAAVTVTDDRRLEGTETANFAIGSLSSTLNGRVSLSDTTHTLTITDNETGSIDFEADKSTGEGPNGEVRAVMTIAGSGTGTVGLDRTVTVSATDPGTGTATGGGVDYTFTPTTYYFYPQSASPIYSNVAWVIPTNDRRLEGNETLNLSLGSLSDTLNGQLSIVGGASHTLTIVDNELAEISIQADQSNAESVDPAINAVLTIVSWSGSGTIGLDTNVTVDATDAGTGTATGLGTDYVAFGTPTLTFTAGDGTSFTSGATLDVVDDAVVESSETVVIQIANAQPANMAAQLTLTDTSHTATIVDNDSTTVSIAATDAAAAEAGADTGTFTVSLAGGSLAPAGGIVVNFAVTGTAASVTDYATIGTSVTIPAGSGSTTITVTPVDDNEVEGTETVIVTLTGTGNAGVTVGTPASATVNIADSDATTVSIAATDAAAAEAGSDTGTFTVSLAGGSVAPVGGIVVNYTVAGTATDGTDYTSIGTSVTIPAGSGSATITVTPTDDNVVEGTTAETVIVTLTTTGNTGVTVDVTPATVNITDNDATTVSITATDAAAAEAGSDVGVFTVSLAGGIVAPAGGVVVNYNATGGTATDGTDYPTIGTSVTIPAGSGSTTITVTPADDSVVEGTETVIVTLTGTLNTGVTLRALSSAQVDIADNDTAAVTVENVTAAEGTGLLFTVTLNADVAGGTTVTVTLGGGTATGGATPLVSPEDYDNVVANLVFVGTAGEPQAFTVATLDDARLEGTETFNVTLSSSNTDVDASDTAVGTIIDNETGVIDIQADQSNAESVDPTINAVLTITASGGSSGTTGLDTSLTVNATQSGGTAGSGQDYTAFGTQTLTFAVGDGAAITSSNATLDVTDDQRLEGDETVIVQIGSLSSTLNGRVSLNGTSHTATIEDNETGVIDFEADKSTGEGPNGEVRAVMTIAGSGTGTVGLDRTVTASATDPLTGTATGGGVDYTFTPTTYYFYPQSASPIYSNVAWVIPTNDRRLEGNETLNLSLGSLSDTLNGQLSIVGGRSHTLTIVDNELAEISIQADQSNAENVDPAINAVLTIVSWSGSGTIGLDTNVTVDATDAGTGTATGLGTDYVAFGTPTLTFTAGDGTSFTSGATLDVVDDDVVESSETVVIQIANALPANMAAQLTLTDTSHTATIVDNDSTTVSIAATDAAAAEAGADTGTFTVSLAGGSLAPAGGIVVNFAVTGTAASVTDYATIGTSVTIPAGSGSTTITVTPVDDNEVEGTETVIVTLTGTGNAGVTVGTPASATVNIADSDATTVSIAATDAAAAEAGSDTGTFTVSLAAGVAPAGGIVVNYTVTGTATDGTDYATIGTSVTIPAGSGSTTITVTPVDDNVVEGTTAETVIVTLTTTGNTGVTVDVTPATVNITDNDATTVSITATDAAAAEAGSDVGVFTVSLAAGVAPAGGVVVNYNATGGTATDGTDYPTIGTSVTIPAGSGSTTITVTPVDDSVVEGTETVIVTLTSTGNTGVTVGAPSSAQVDIADNDTAAVTVENVTAAEGTGLLFTVTLNADVAGGTTVTVTLGGGTATGGATPLGSPADYDNVVAAGLVFAGTVGETRTFTVATLDDARLEGTETFNVTLSSSNPVVNASDTAVGTIIDNETGVIDIQADQSNAESVDPTINAVLTITASGGSSGTTGLDTSLTVNATQSGGTAGSGQDYTAFGTQTLTFAVGDGVAITSGNATLDVTDDQRLEGDETVIVQIGSLSSTLNGLVSLNDTSHTATIEDNETGVIDFEADKSQTESPNAEVRAALTIAAVGSGTIGLDQTLTVTGSDGGGGTATGGGVDFSFGPTTMSFFPASAASINSTIAFVTVVSDRLLEADETANLSIGGLSDDLDGQVTLGDTALVLTILDNESGVINIRADQSNAESVDPTVNAVLTITASGGGNVGLGTNLTVVATQTGGTAASGTDYTAFGTPTLTFTSGLGTSITSNNATLDVTDDLLLEGPETVIIQIGTLLPSLGARVTLNDTSHTATIVDNETGVINFEADKSVAEGAGSTTLQATLTIASSGVGTVGLAQALTVVASDAGTGTAGGGGVDYSFATTTLTFAAGSGSATIGSSTAAVTVVNDASPEGPETANFTIGSLSSTLGGQVSLVDTTHTLTITDNDGGPAAPVLKYDFGQSSAVTQAGYTYVDRSYLYNATRGFGWSQTVGRTDRPYSGFSNLNRDLHYSGVDATFRVLVGAGSYNVRVYLANPLGTGGTPYQYGNFGVTVEGTAQQIVTLVAAGTIGMLTFSGGAPGVDGILDIAFDSIRNSTWIVSGMEISTGALPTAINYLTADEAAASPGGVTIDDAMLAPLVSQAAAQWLATGLTPAQTAVLADLHVGVGNLPESRLGAALSTTNDIRIDDDAAGWGWSVIGDRSSVIGGQWSVIGDGLPVTDYRSPITGLDLMHTLMHEIGHLLGYEHSEEGLMAPTLAAPVRPSSFIPDRLSHIDNAFADLGRAELKTEERGDGAVPALLAAKDEDLLAALPVRTDEEAAQTRVVRRRLERYEQELDDWFAGLAAEPERV